MVEHEKISSSVASNNNLSIIALKTFKRHNVLTIALPTIFSVVTTA